MIYQIRLNINISINIDENYYNTLGSILNICGDDKSLKDSILCISNIYKKYNNEKSLSLTIKGKNNFDSFISLVNTNPSINLNGKIFKIESIDFNFQIFDDNIIYKEFKKFEITYKTPTIVKKELNGIDINQLLPTPEIFLLSGIRKYIKIFPKEIDLNELKIKIKNNIIISSLDIRSSLVKIKGNKKAGIIGKVKYEIINDNDIEFKKLIYNALYFSTLVGLGTGNRLGLGQISVYFIK